MISLPTQRPVQTWFAPRTYQIDTSTDNGLQVTGTVTIADLLPADGAIELMLH